MDQNEINALLANEIRNAGLNDVIKLNTIREKVMQKIQEMSNDINEMENPVVAQSINEFPNQEEDEQFKTPDIVSEPDNNSPKIGMEAGAQPLDVQYEPKTAIIPEIPDFLKDVPPGKIFVYDFNELSVGGENLSNKPFKTFENPEISKSMSQMWSENGITKAEVYQTKFEKIGEVVFDYKSGMSQFIEKRFEPEIDVQQQYNKNVYAQEPNKEIESFIKQNVDVESKINDVITNIVKNYFLTNSERAVNSPEYTNEPANGAVNSPENYYVNENTITVNKLVKEFNKVPTPIELIESIQGNSKKAKLVYEDKEIKKWVLGDKEYYLPSDPMSIRMCYSK